MRRLDPRRSLAAAVAWEVTFITLVTAIVASLWFASIARDRIEDQIGATFRQYATQISNELDINLYTTLQSLRVTTALFDNTALAGDMDRARQLLPGIHKTLPYLEWIAVANPDGRVLAATDATDDAIAQGSDVSGQPWFKEGRNAPWLGDTHKTAAIATLLARTRDGARSSIVNLGAPIRDGRGRLIGVIGAELNLEWIRSLETGLTESLRAQRSVETLLVASDGVVLFGPASLVGQQIKGPAQAAATEALNVVKVALSEHKAPSSEVTSGQLITRWEDGREYLAGYAVSDGVGAYPGGIGWTVWVREPTVTVFGPVYEQRQQNFIALTLLGLLTAVVATFAARRLTRRLTHITRSADDIRAGRRHALEVPQGEDEAARIGESLRQLLDALQKRNRELEELNRELDARVASRTREVERLANENREAAVVRERLRLARDLHDTLAHSIMALLTQIRVMRKLTTANPAMLGEELASAEEAARSGLQKARSAIAELRQEVVRNMGLGAGLRQLLVRIQERLGIEVDYDADIACEAMADSRAETLCRIAEEALRNVERHAHARHVSVSLRHAGDGSSADPVSVVLSIEDDGVGFDAGSAHREGHYGLRGMYELAETVGAALTVQSEPERGTRIDVKLKL